MARKNRSTGATSVVEPETRTEPQQEQAPLTKEQQRIMESREVLKHPCPNGQAFFEAPDGYIIVAEADRMHVIYKLPNGKEMNINPRRAGGR